MEELVNEAKRGNDEAFSQLITMHKKELYLVAKSKLNNEDDIADCIQETILKCYKNIKQLKDSKLFKYWMLKILINECHRLYKKKKKVEVSKKKIMEESTVLKDIDAKSEFRNITISVDKVTTTPIQTIIQIRHLATNQTTSKIMNRNDGIEWMPMTNYYTVYDENGNQLDNIVLSNWHTLIYEDGTTRTYDSHDIPQDNITNASYETICYMVLENTDSSKITIVPTEEVHDLIDGVDPEHIDMEAIEINLK